MQPELTLNTKCPACGTLKPKTLAAIKAQTVFACDCGFHAAVLNCVQPAAESKTATRRRKAAAI